MNKLQALTALRDKVKAGQDNSELWRPALSDHGVIAMHAFHGSLDAAKALHDAVLQDFVIHRIGQRYGGVCEADIMQLSADGWHNASKDARFSVFNDDPARAWLLAILEALIAQEGQE